MPLLKDSLTFNLTESQFFAEDIDYFCAWEKYFVANIASFQRLQVSARNQMTILKTDFFALDFARERTA